MKLLRPCVLSLAVSPVLLSAQQTIVGSFMHNGILRDHRLYIPASYSPGIAAPLVFNLHGYTSDAFQQELYADFRSIADTAGFLIVHPNGTLDGTGNRFWNAFGTSAVDDLGYLIALLDTISAHYTVDPDRVYSTGMSNGGFMSHELACFASDRFTAIASVTGTMLFAHMSACAATHPTPVMQIHGTADPTVNYNGGSGSVAVEDLVQNWAGFNNCSTPPVVTPVPDTAPNDGCTAEHWVYEDGDAGSTVELFKVFGGGHTWPGAPIAIGVTNQDIDASTEIWRFFSRYSLDDLVGIADNPLQAPSFIVSVDPGGDALRVRFKDQQDRTIRLCNAMGQMLAEQRINGMEAFFRVPGAGLVLVIVQGENVPMVQRVVVP